MNKLIFYIVLLFLFVNVDGFSQNNLSDFETEIASLDGLKKYERYVSVVSSQITVSPNTAIKLAEKALSEAKIKNFPSENAQLLKLVGDAYFLTGDYPKAMDVTHKAIKKFEELQDDDNLAAAYILLARVNKQASGDCNQSRDYYLKAESLYRQTKNYKEVATAQNYLGNLQHFCYHNLDEALKYYRKTESYYKQTNDTIGLSYSYDFISQVLGEQNKLDEAIDYQQKSLALRLLLKDTFSIAISYTNIGEIYLLQKKNEAAAEYYEKALNTIKNHNFNDLKSYLLNCLSNTAIEKGDYKSAYSYLVEKKSVDDSLLSESRLKQLSEMKTKYETEKKEIALEEEVVKNKNKTLLLLVLISAILVLIIVIFLIFQRRKMDRQQLIISNLKNIEAERTRIARDLHDNLGAELTLISSRLDMKAFKTTNEAEKKDLSDIREISTNANHVLRETIWSIHKESLTIGELYRKAEEYARRIFKDKDIRILVSVDNESATISPSIALHLFRIIQEAVNNAFKYSNCSELVIDINPKKIEISDNGNGFEIDTAKKGYGLQNMGQRAKEIKALVSVTSELGKGTSIVLKY